jgi:hypothetical protein
MSLGFFPLVTLKLNSGVYDIVLLNQNNHPYAGNTKLGVLIMIPVFAGMLTSKVNSF